VYVSQTRIQALAKVMLLTASNSVTYINTVLRFVSAILGQLTIFIQVVM